MRINVEQHSIPFDYIEACRQERELMLTTALAWKAAVVAQDISPLIEKTYHFSGADGDQAVSIRFSNDTQLLLDLNPGDEEAATKIYQYDTASQQLSFGGEVLRDSEQQYNTFVRVHKVLYIACDEERQRINTQG